MLSGKRSVVVLEKVGTLSQDPFGSAPAIAHVEPGVIGEIKECNAAWCRVSLEGYKGWIMKTSVWGAYGFEQFKD
jgi:SH3-like domain-containing protein